MIKAIPLFFSVAIFFFFTDIADAANFVTCRGADCSACNLVEMANIIIKWLIGILFLVFAILMLRAGFGLLTSGGNPGAFSAAKDSFKNAIIGLLIILAAWLIVDTLMRGLLRDGTGSIQGYGPWSQVQCQVQNVPETGPEPQGATVPPPAGTTGGLPSGFTPGQGSGGLTADEARAQLTAAGLNHGNVISYAGLQPHVVDAVAAMNRECGCNITVTEATGGTHSMNGQYRHDNGYKLDLRTRDNPALTQFVQNNFQSAGTWSNGTPVYQRQTQHGVQRCALERTHMDCQFIPGR